MKAFTAFWRKWRGAHPSDPNDGPFAGVVDFEQEEPSFKYDPTSFVGVSSQQRSSTRPPTTGSTLNQDSSYFTGQHHNPRERYVADRALHPQQHTLVYASRASSISQPHTQLRELRDSCALRNHQAGVRSGLVMQDGMFCQWLQGPLFEVESTWERIQRDPRHSAPIILFRGSAAINMLDAWSMGLRSLYMGQGDAFKRVQRLRLKVRTRPYESPFEAWSDFTGVLCPEHLGAPAGEPPQTATPRPRLLLLGLRSEQGGRLLSDAAKGRQGGLAVSRWGAAADKDCDLQTQESVLPVAGTDTHVLSASTPSLRAGVVRESLRQCSHWVLTLDDDDVARLNAIVSAIERHSPPELVPQRVSVLAPQWHKDSAAHAEHLLKTLNWPGRVIAVDVMRRGSWERLAEALAA